MKAQINGIEIPWSVTSLDVLARAGQLKEYENGEYGLELIETFTNGFNYLKGQLVEVGLTGVGRTPAIITKVHDRDENGHLTYDIIILLGNRSKSSIESKERYLWRFVEQENNETIENFNKLISAIFTPEYGYDVYFSHEYGIDSICYLTDDSIISYDLTQIKSRQHDAGNVLTKFGFGGTSNKENLCQTQLPKRGQTSSIVNVDERPFTEGKTLSELCGKEGEDNEHY